MDRSSASAPILPSFHPIVLKLDRHNYTFWRAQVLPTIRAHGFEEYISATAMPPAPLLPSPSGVAPRPNPEYNTWIRRDQFLLSWMLASIGDSMLGHVVRCNTAKDVWLTLERLSFSQSKARTMQLRMALQTTRKGSLSIEEYFLKMRGYADQLSAIGQIVTDDELQMYILAGFGMEYEALVVNFMQRVDSPSLQELQLAFQAYELRISQQLNHYSLTDSSANAAFYGGARGVLGRGSGVSGGSGGSALLADGSVQEGGGEEHTWYMDSGATTHITNELANLNLSADYHGSDTVMVGNGQAHLPNPAEG